MRILKFLEDYWYIPLLVLGVVVGAIAFRRFDLSIFKARLSSELEAIETKREVREIQLQLGTEQAKQHTREKYAAKWKTLDANARAQALELEHDPVKLSLFLGRITTHTNASTGR